jgi:hypothetical protein
MIVHAHPARNLNLLRRIHLRKTTAVLNKILVMTDEMTMVEDLLLAVTTTIGHHQLRATIMEDLHAAIHTEDHHHGTTMDGRRHNNNQISDMVDSQVHLRSRMVLDKEVLLHNKHMADHLK